MMSDLISRQAALDALGERCESECEYSKKQRSVMCDACYLGSAKEVIEEVPNDGCEYWDGESGFCALQRPADPVKHGKWCIEPDGTVMHCYCCGWAYEYYAGLEEEWNYCPHCGARMDL